MFPCLSLLRRSKEYADGPEGVHLTRQHWRKRYSPAALAWRVAEDSPEVSLSAPVHDARVRLRCVRAAYRLLQRGLTGADTRPLAVPRKMKNSRDLKNFESFLCLLCTPSRSTCLKRVEKGVAALLRTVKFNELSQRAVLSVVSQGLRELLRWLPNVAMALAGRHKGQTAKGGSTP